MLEGSLGRLAGEECNIAILMGMLIHEGAIKRTAGLESVINDYPGIKVLAREAGDWQKDQGMAITENWLTAHDDLDAIISNNDEMAIGAINALEVAGRNDIIVMGVDATPDAIKLVTNGKLAATVFQDSVGQGEGAVEVVHNVLKENEQDKIKWIDFVLVTPENVANYQ